MLPTRTNATVSCPPKFLRQLFSNGLVLSVPYSCCYSRLPTITDVLSFGKCSTYNYTNEHLFNYRVKPRPPYNALQRLKGWDHRVTTKIMCPHATCPSKCTSLCISLPPTVMGYYLAIARYIRHNLHPVLSVGPFYIWYNPLLSGLHPCYQ